MNISQIGQHAVIRSWWALKLTFGLVFVIAGADKFFNIITQWSKYISPTLLHIVPLNASQLMMIAGIVEILLGVLILFIATRMGAYLTALWLTVIAINLIILGGYLDIAIRDLGLAIGLLVLAWLDEAMPSLRK